MPDETYADLRVAEIDVYRARASLLRMTWFLVFMVTLPLTVALWTLAVRMIGWSW